MISKALERAVRQEIAGGTSPSALLDEIRLMTEDYAKWDNPALIAREDLLEP